MARARLFGMRRVPPPTPLQPLFYLFFFLFARHAIFNLAVRAGRKARKGVETADTPAGRLARKRTRNANEICQYTAENGREGSPEHLGTKRGWFCV